MSNNPIAPLEPILQDPDINEILIDGSQHVYVERHGQLEDITPSPFRDDAQLMETISAILAMAGRKVDESHPFIDVRLSDDSRVHVVIPPISLVGPVMVIRKMRIKPITAEFLVNNGACTVAMLEFLRACVRGRANLVVTGGTGTGKTSVINLLASWIGDDERVIAMQTAGELQLKNKRLVLLETRPPNIEGRGEVSMRDLVQNALKMRPERLVMGEIRGGEAFDMLDAMRTGHDGSMFTIHANNPRDALARLEVMVTMGNPSVSVRGAREMLASAINVMVQLERLSDGKRRIIAITEVQGVERDVIVTQDIFRFEQHGVDTTGQVKGQFVATGQIPSLAKMLKTRGAELKMEWFAPS
jgi:pilus assembly protein CpaF